METTSKQTVRASERNPGEAGPRTLPSPRVAGTRAANEGPAGVDADETKDRQNEDAERARFNATRAEMTTNALFTAGQSEDQTTLLWLSDDADAPNEITVFIGDERDEEHERITGVHLYPWDALKLGEFLTGWARGRMGPDVELRSAADAGANRLTAETLLDDVPNNLTHMRRKVDLIWYALEQACAPDGKRDMPRDECHSSGRQAVYELLQTLAAVEDDLKTTVKLIACPAKSAAPKATAARAIPVAPAALPRMIWPTDLEQASVPELLLFALAGAGASDHRPLDSVAFRLADELEMITALAHEDGEAAATLLFHASGRAKVLAELLRRQGRGQ